VSIVSPVARTGLLQTSHVVVLDLQFDAASLRRALPPELEAADSHQAFLLIFTAGPPDEEPARSGAFLGVFLKGRDAPDGSPGIFVSDGLYDFEIGQARAYTTRFEPGAAEISIAGDEVTGGITANGRPAMDFALHVRRDERVLNMGTHQYFGLRPGGLNTYSIAFAARVLRAELTRLVVHEETPGLLGTITAGKVIGVTYAPSAPLTFSHPRPIASHEPIAAADTAHLAILEVLASVGRAAVVVDAAGHVLFGNPRGLEATAPLLKGRRLSASTAQEQAQLAQLLNEAAHLRTPPTGERLALHRPDGSPVLVQAGSYRGGWNGVATALLMIYDPRAEAQFGPVQGLELLGLTPSEARIAAAIGSGLSARAASETLTLSENTVRSALKAIYAKLGISSRTQLASIVTQLRMPA